VWGQEVEVVEDVEVMKGEEVVGRPLVPPLRGAERGSGGEVPGASPGLNTGESGDCASAHGIGGHELTPPAALWY